MTNGSESQRYQAELARLRAGFVQRGESIADWSRQHGFPPNAVYQVLHGYTHGLRGKAHHIAVALGVKASPGGPQGPASSEEQLM
jgi:gp16 family phage-associated protein